MAEAPHWDATLLCTRAAIGDAAVLLVVYWIVSGAARSRTWIVEPALRQVAAFTALGVGITVIFERLATGFFDRWQYSDTMPVLPLLHVGVSPLLQWLLLPPLLLWFVRRQIT